jgi:hypothetical protein
MKLIPRTPPGRTNRKARAFWDDIARLRKEGYGYVAIQEALGDAGVVVSKSTVQREVARLSSSMPLLALQRPAAPLRQVREPDSTNPTTAAPRQLTGERRSGKDVAEAFMKGRITNPLIRNRS